MKCLTTILTVALALGTTAAQAATASTMATTLPRGDVWWRRIQRQQLSLGLRRQRRLAAAKLRLRGGEIIQSEGQYNANSAKAAIDYAGTLAGGTWRTSRDGEETYFEQRRMNREISGGRSPRPSPPICCYCPGGPTAATGAQRLGRCHRRAITHPAILSPACPNWRRISRCRSRFLPSGRRSAPLDVDEYLKVFQTTGRCATT